MRNKRKIAEAGVVLAVILLCAGALWWNAYSRAQGGQAVIGHNGREILRLDLAGEDCTIDLAPLCGAGMVIERRGGAVRVLFSDCPDGICVNTGFIRAKNQSAICLPNRVALTIE